MVIHDYRAPDIYETWLHALRPGDILPDSGKGSQGLEALRRARPMLVQCGSAGMTGDKAQHHRHDDGIVPVTNHWDKVGD